MVNEEKANNELTALRAENEQLRQDLEVSREWARANIMARICARAWSRVWKRAAKRWRRRALYSRRESNSLSEFLDAANQRAEVAETRAATWKKAAKRNRKLAKSAIRIIMALTESNEE